MKSLLIAPLLLFSIFIFSCRKSKPAASTSNSVVVKKAKGEVIGLAITKEIGSAGGTIESADHTIKVTVPAGAVDQTTSFSIQQVTNMLGSRAKSYRLLPEGTAFMKDLLIEYSYAGLDLGGSDLLGLSLVYQSADGTYRKAVRTSDDKSKKLLSVATRHFSDWTFTARMDLVVTPAGNDSKTYLKKGGKASFRVKHYETEAGSGDAFGDDPKLIEVTLDHLVSFTWSHLPAIGQLDVVQYVGQAGYTAPATIPQLQVVQVSVKVNSNSLGKDPFGNNITQMILTHEVVLMPDQDPAPGSDQYFKLIVDGQQQYLKTLTADYVPGWISIGGYTAANDAFNIYVFASGTGTFPYNIAGTPNAANMEYLLVSIDGYIHMRPKTCGVAGGLVFSSGGVVLTKIAKNKGEYTEGTFTAELFRTSYCATGGSKQVSGEFRILKN